MQEGGGGAGEAFSSQIKDRLYTDAKIIKKASEFVIERVDGKWWDERQSGGTVAYAVIGGKECVLTFPKGGSWVRVVRFSEHGTTVDREDRLSMSRKKADALSRVNPGFTSSMTEAQKQSNLPLVSVIDRAGKPDKTAPHESIAREVLMAMEGAKSFSLLGTEKSNELDPDAGVVLGQADYYMRQQSLEHMRAERPVLFNWVVRRLVFEMKQTYPAVFLKDKPGEPSTRLTDRGAMARDERFRLLAESLSFDRMSAIFGIANLPQSLLEDEYVRASKEEAEFAKHQIINGYLREGDWSRESTKVLIIDVEMDRRSREEGFDYRVWDKRRSEIMRASSAK